MNLRIHPSTAHGTIDAPPSKSITHRAIVLAAIARGMSTIKNPLIADDTMRTINACKALGVEIQRSRDTLTIHGKGGVLSAAKKSIYIGNSGTTLRLITAVAVLAKGKTTLTGDKRLQERPMSDLLYALRTLGISIESQHHNGHAPLTVVGGLLQGGKVKISAAVSSQFVSALLLIAPFAKGPLTINVRGAIRVKSNIDMTLNLMRQFDITVVNHDYESLIVKAPRSYRATTITIEGDYTSASYLFAAAAITGSSIKVGNLNPKSLQGDRVFLAILKKMGCKVRKNAHAITVVGPKRLKAITTDMGDHPDIVQTVAAVAAHAEGTTHLTNIEHLIHKEFDRIENTAKVLRGIGVVAQATHTSLIIQGGRIKGGRIDTHNDHRIAMSMAIAALRSIKGITIRHPEVVSKSYPNFFEDLQKIGVTVVS